MDGAEREPSRLELAKEEGVRIVSRDRHRGRRAQAAIRQQRLLLPGHRRDAAPSTTRSHAGGDSDRLTV